MTEFEIQSKVFAWTVSLEPLIPEFKYIYGSPNGDYRPIRVGRRLKEAGTKPGFPDIFWPYPNSQFAGLFVEQKKIGGELSEEQDDWITYLKTANYSVHVSYTVKETIRLILVHYFEGREVYINEYLNMYYNDEGNSC